MFIVDSHCHAAINWFEPVELILHQMNLNGVEKAVLIQHGGNYDNRYLIECVKRFPGRFAAVIAVDPTQPDSPVTLESLAKQEGVAGLRLRPTDRSPGSDPLALWRKAAEVGLPVSCFAINVEHVATQDFRTLVESVPQCTIVLEHQGGLYKSVGLESAKPPFTAYRTVLTLARLPNVYMKIGGLGEFCARPAILQPRFGFGDIPPIIDMALEAFGPNRLMWGSDFPPVGEREGYRNALRGVMELGVLSKQQEKEAVFGKTAASVFRLDKS